jgi:hypothetical protein
MHLPRRSDHSCSTSRPHKAGLSAALADLCYWRSASTDISALFREKIFRAEQPRIFMIMLHNINVLARFYRRAGTAAEQPRNSRLTATEQREQQRGEQPGTAPGTAGLNIQHRQ